jgi:hypothetical protein
MFNDLMPNISRHFLYSVLERDQNNGMEIIQTISTLQPEQVEEFLFSLGNTLAGYFFRLEDGLEDYDKIRIKELQDLKNLPIEDDVEEMN